MTRKRRSKAPSPQPSRGDPHPGPLPDREREKGGRGSAPSPQPSPAGGRGSRSPRPSRERSTESGEGRSRTRTALFTLLALAFPFLLLALFEGGLRIGGYGRDLEPLFIDAPGRPDYRQANPEAVKRFFADASAAPKVSIETAYFKAAKPPGSFRVVVQGASSAAGFPYGLGASLAGMLEQRLRRSYPDREIEVISTAMAAVNTYALVDFADEILAEQPDAIVIYIGHNEYLGILGVGSTLRFASQPWITRALLAVRELRLFQWMHSLLTRPPERSAATSADDTLMATVAGERSIPLGSTLYERGVEQYRHNLSRLLSIYADAGVPVFVGTVASNESDQPPFSGEAARAQFTEARQLESGGRYLEARDAYLEAKDLDELRFRAPEAFNGVVREQAARHGAVVVDAQSTLAVHAEHGIIGADLMLEHVHPNLDGYFWLADAFYDAIVASGLLSQPSVHVDEDTARTEVPVSPVDYWLGEYKVMRIRNAWPFRERSVPTELPPASSEGERLAQQLYRQEINWPEAQDALRRHAAAQGDTAEYARTTQILADAFPFVPALQFDAARALIAIDRPRDSLRYGRRAVEISPRDLNSLLVHAHAAALSGKRDEAISSLERALEIDPSNGTAQRALEQLRAPAAAAPP